MLIASVGTGLAMLYRVGHSRNNGNLPIGSGNMLDLNTINGKLQKVKALTSYKTATAVSRLLSASNRAIDAGEKNGEEAMRRAAEAERLDAERRKATEATKA